MTEQVANQLLDIVTAVRFLPEREQQAFVRDMTERLKSHSTDTEVFHIPDEDMPGVLEGLAQIERGEYASAEDVQRVLYTPWV